MTEKQPEVQKPDEVAGVNVDVGKKEEIQVDVQAKIDAAINEVSNNFKSEIAGLNRKNSEMQETLKQKELEGKSDAEKTELMRLEKEKIEQEIVALNRGRLIDKHLDSAGLPLEFAKRISGEDEANIEIDIREFSEYIDKLAQEKADKIINERLGGKPPEGGETPAVGEITREQFEQMSPFEKAGLVKKGTKII